MRPTGNALHGLDEVAGRGHRKPQHMRVAVVPVAGIVDAHSGAGRRHVQRAVGGQAHRLGGAHDRTAVGMADVGDRDGRPVASTVRSTSSLNATSRGAMSSA